MNYMFPMKRFLFLYRYIKRFYRQIIVSFSFIVILFMSIGFLTATEQSTRFTSPLFSTWTSNLDEQLFMLLFSMENRSFATVYKMVEDVPTLSEMAFQLMMSINLDDVKTLLAHELPGFALFENHIIIEGDSLDDVQLLSSESGPPLEDVLEDRKAIDDTDEEEQKEQKIDRLSEDIVLLYNSHNRESFLPHLPDEKNPNLAYHEEVNITRVSDRIAETLANYGIASHVDHTDFMEILHEKGWKYGKSYAASRPVVKKAIEQNNDIQFAFDIHRDSLPRDKTTKSYKDESYATILFIIGAENKGYKKNIELAKELHYIIDKNYPGISKGVITKEGANVNGVYNQDLLENSVLIEIGGYENTLEEMYRSADVLAEAFSDYYWGVEKVNK